MTATTAGVAAGTKRRKKSINGEWYWECRSRFHRGDRMVPRSLYSPEDESKRPQKNCWDCYAFLDSLKYYRGKGGRKPKGRGVG